MDQRYSNQSDYRCITIVGMNCIAIGVSIATYDVGSIECIYIRSLKELYVQHLEIHHIRATEV